MLVSCFPQFRHGTVDGGVDDMLGVDVHLLDQFGVEVDVETMNVVDGGVAVLSLPDDGARLGAIMLLAT